MNYSSRLSVARVRVYQTGEAQPCAPFEFVTLQFQGESYDIGEMHEAVTNPTRLTAPIGGLFLIQCQITTQVPDILVALFIYKNGSSTGLQTSAVSHPQGSFLQIMGSLALNARDYVEIVAWTNSEEEPVNILAPIATMSYLSA